MRNLLLLAILFLSLQLTVAQTRVKGVVFADKNQNGLYERGERGVKSAAVTNGDTVVWCDRRGGYSIDLADDDYVSVILPDGYISAGAEAQNGARRFANEGGEINFPMLKQKSSNSCHFAIIGDPQVDNAQQFTYAQISMSEIAARKDLVGAILMGDLVNDNVEDLPIFSSIIAQMPQPTWSIIGNHDITRERTNSAFVQSIGADVTAFYRGSTCFVLLNNVEGKSRSFLSTASLRFVQQMADSLDDEALLVVCQHIPLGYHKQRDALLAALGDQKTLILSAHAHRLFRERWSDNVAEVSVGALCGHWWTGERGTDGLPLALQQCGTPPCYFMFDFNDGDYSFSVEVVGDKAKGELYYSSEIDFDDSVEPLSELAPRSLLANIYGSSVDDTHVEWSLDGDVWHAMEHVDMISPRVARLIYLNKKGEYPSNVSRRQPMRRMSSPQIWSATLPDDVVVGVHKITVRATDKGGLQDVVLERIISVE